MLSDTLQALASRFDGWSATGGVHLDAPACAILRDVLGAAADDAGQVEALPVPAEARAGVISLDAAREARHVRRAGGDWGAA
jgi:hypothetical protein